MSTFIKRERLGSKMIDLGLITKEQLDEALKLQKKTGDKIGTCLQKLGFVTERQILKALESQYGIPSIDLSTYRVDYNVINKVPESIARRHNIIPVKIENNKLYVAIEDPFNFLALDDVRLVAGMEVKPMIATGEGIESLVKRIYSNESTKKVLEELSKGNLEEIQNIKEAEDEIFDSAPVVRLVNSILDQAIKEKSSDIHIEPGENEVRVRYRVDGQLQTAMTVPKNLHSALTTRLKIMASLDIAEKRVPQDGRYDAVINGKYIDIRISVLPTIYGEKIVLRILDRSSFMIEKDKLGLSRENMVKFDRILSRPNGIILVTGPTGSGKTTTLYVMLNELNRENVNIITVEDPVEYMMPGLNQVQVNTKANMTFANGLRAILRQDPDIIMVGEIRDSETADIAIRAAITGHLVLSTIHTNDAASTVARLADMGIESYLLSASLTGIIAQRLMRKICPRCKEEYKPSEYELMISQIPDFSGNFARGAGCSYCNNTGYRGRIAIHEIMEIDKPIRNLISNNVTSSDVIRETAIKNGMSTLFHEARNRVMEGVTSFEEMVRVAFTED